MKKERGRSGKSWLLALGAVALAAAGGCGVPLALRNFEDAKRLSQVTAEAAAEVRITPQTELGIAEKAELFRSGEPTGAQYLRISALIRLYRAAYAVVYELRLRAEHNVVWSYVPVDYACTVQSR